MFVFCSICVMIFFFFKQKTAYEMRISDWSSDVCSSDLNATNALFQSGCTTAEVASVTGHKTLAMLELYGRDRDQSKMSIVAMGKWSKTNQERENRNKKGKTGQ